MAREHLRRLTVNFSGTVRRVHRGGRDYLVAPMVLINPGVLNGSKGPLLYPPDEIAKNSKAWNGMPIVVYHPHRLGQPVSATEPGILDRQGVGEVRNATSNGKLRAEGWFDAEKTRRVNPSVYNRLLKSEPIELSTGLYTDNEEQSGTFNGRQYVAVARNYRPDHLAVLPDQVGACSVQDGCGVLVNASNLNHKLLKILDNEWSEEARQKALEARRMKSGGGQPDHPSSAGNDAQRSYPHMAHLLNGVRVHSASLPRQRAIAEAKSLRSKGVYASVFSDDKGKRGSRHMVVIPENTPSLNKESKMSLKSKLSLLVNEGQDDQSSSATILSGENAGKKLESLFAVEENCDMEKNCDQPLRNRLAALLGNEDQSAKDKDQKNADEARTIELETDHPSKAKGEAEDHDLINGDAESEMEDVETDVEKKYQDHLGDAEDENDDTEIKLNAKLQRLSATLNEWSDEAREKAAEARKNKGNGEQRQFGDRKSGYRVTGGDSDIRAAAEARRSGSRMQSTKSPSLLRVGATRATSKANSSGLPADHAKAAELHRQAMTSYSKAGDKKGAIHHQKMMKRHAQKAGGIHNRYWGKLDNQLSVKLQQLVSNWDGPPEDDEEDEDGWNDDQQEQETDQEQPMPEPPVSPQQPPEQPTAPSDVQPGQTPKAWLMTKIAALVGEYDGMPDSAVEQIPVAGDKPTDVMNRNHNKRGGPTMAKVKLTANERKTVVDGLINNSECCWEESDRKVLNGLGDVTLAKLYRQTELVKNAEGASADQLDEDDNKDVAVEEEATKAGDSQADGNEKPKGDLEPKAGDGPANNALSERDRRDLAFARRYRMEQRGQHIGVITSNAQNRFSLKQLQQMNDDVLANLASLAKPTENEESYTSMRPSFFGAQGAAVMNADANGDEEPLQLGRIDFKAIAAGK